VVGRLREAGVVATIRAPSAESATRAVAALVEGGITAIEVTYSTPDVPHVLDALQAEFGERILLGAGTITRSGQGTDTGASRAVHGSADPSPRGGNQVIRDSR
jgi:2-dehydro-3-deoxyphosphogluconate aldolase / (4S)-4-hydroxy-2-oxoglutarate aldolase